MTTTLTRLSASAAAALVLGAVLTGCGSDSKSDDKSDKADKAPKVTALSTADAEKALLTLGNLGDNGFTLDEDADHTSGAPGCLDGFDAITDASDAPTHVVRDFTAGSETGFPLISSSVDSYDSVEDAKEALEDFRDAMADCTTVDDTDSDGVATKLAVTTSDDKTDDSTDDQVNLTAVGTIAATDGSYPLGLWAAAVRIDNHVHVITVGDLDDAAPGDIEELVQVVNDRLIAVAKGDEPDDDAVAGD
ncbi:hypothetical protein ABIE44_001015 [Marmoricola sp. OAE513]|uniref:hypothetical protein n=1 Tax=Marmoricola sp. OAE513 TaxID=2817894 RepID=UPI001AE6BD2A